MKMKGRSRKAKNLLHVRGPFSSALFYRGSEPMSASGGRDERLDLPGRPVAHIPNHRLGGLWYPIGVAVMTLFIGLIFLKETRGVDISTSSGVSLQNA